MHNEKKVITSSDERVSPCAKKSQRIPDRPYTIEVEHGTLTFPDILQVMDHAQMLATQISSMLAATYGTNQDVLEEMGQRHRDNYMWHLHQQHCELVDALRLICDPEGRA